MRPRQWVKNVLVATAPLAAGQLFAASVLGEVGLAFVAFCLVSATVYLINDIRDVDGGPAASAQALPADRRRRAQSPDRACVLAVVTGALGLALGFLVAVPLGITLVVYLGLQILYSAFLKHLPVVDLAMVASGFLLRAIAGGVATGIPLSQWFLLVAAFGSFFMVAGKRYSEMKAIGGEAGTRRSLTRYSESYLRFAWMLAAVMVLISYSLWAFENRGAGGRSASRGPRSRSLRSPWACCSTRSRSTPETPANRRRSCCTIMCCKGSERSGSWSSRWRCSS